MIECELCEVQQCCYQDELVYIVWLVIFGELVLGIVYEINQLLVVVMNYVSVSQWYLVVFGSQFEVVGWVVEGLVWIGEYVGYVVEVIKCLCVFLCKGQWCLQVFDFNQVVCEVIGFCVWEVGYW